MIGELVDKHSKRQKNSVDMSAVCVDEIGRVIIGSRMTSQEKQGGREVLLSNYRTFSRH